MHVVTVYAISAKAEGKSKGKLQKEWTKTGKRSILRVNNGGGVP